MKITITHARNILLGCDIDVKADGEDGEKVAFVEVRVNGFPEVTETPDDPLDSWEKQLTQQGVFPETIQSWCWCAIRMAKRSVQAGVDLTLRARLPVIPHRPFGHAAGLGIVFTFHRRLVHGFNAVGRDIFNRLERK